MTVALKRRRVEARRKRVAQARYEAFTCRAALLRLRNCCRAAAARRRAALLAQFASSSRLATRTLAALRRRANVFLPALQALTNMCSKRLESDRICHGLLFWKLWRTASGLQRWKAYLNARRTKRYEWVQSQQAHRADLCALGVRLWVAAAGDKQAHRVDALAESTLRSAWRHWKSSCHQARLRPSPSVVFGHRGYVRIRPMNSVAPLSDASTNAAAAVAAKYAGVAPRTSAAQALLPNPVTEAATTATATGSQPARSLHSALAPASPPPLHRAPPRTFLYDQEIINAHGDKRVWETSQTSPVSVTHAVANSPDSRDSGHHQRGSSTANEVAADSVALAALRKKSARIAIAHEIIGLVTELKGRLL